jgi:hypothetical protein
MEMTAILAAQLISINLRVAEVMTKEKFLCL